MRYVVIGAGAIGSGIGGLLLEAGVPVVLVARGEHRAAMAAGGLRVLTPERQIVVRPDVAAGPAEVALTDDDVLVLTTKTHQAPAALATWADAPVHADGEVVGTAGERLPILTALNGVASEEMALRWFRRVYAVCVWMPAVLSAAGEVVVRCGPTRAILHAGRYPATLTERADHVLLERIAADWERAAISVPRPDDPMRWKYRKLLGNLGNAVQALLGERGAGDDITEAARAEAQSLYQRAGIETNTDEEERASRAQLQVQPVPGAPEEMGGSTWQSLQRGTGSAETDYLNGEIVALAHRLGTHAPINSGLAQTMRDVVARGQRPGSMSAPGLRRRLGVDGDAP